MRHAIPWLVCGWLFFGGMVAGSCLAAVGAETDPRTITDLPAAEAKRLAVSETA